MSQEFKSILSFSIFCCFVIFASTDNAVSPSRPRQCYSCEGINCQRITKQNVTTTCTDLLDICVTIFEGSAVMTKGCYLDIPEQQREKCTESNDFECFKCFGELCNNKGREDFKCFECNDNTKCAEDTSTMTPVSCPIPSAPNSYCYIRNLGGNRVERGCYVHIFDQVKCLNDTNCSMCLSSDGVACNSYKVSTVSKNSSIQSFVNKYLFSAMIMLFIFVGIL